MQNRSGGATVVFLVTALVLVTALAVLLRFRPEAFGVAPQDARPEYAGEGSRLDAPSEPIAEPEGPLARYEPRPTAPRAALRREEWETVELFRLSRRSVCFVSSILRGRAETAEPTATEHVQGTGSGIVWDTSGHIVTTYHVVEGSDAARVTLPDGSEHDAWLVGTDESLDLTVMRIDVPPDRLTPFVCGTSADLHVGQRVLSIGFPYGLDHTLSEGLVSGLQRSIRTPRGNILSGVIQTDADLHPGSSGGPLLDSAGRVIGMSVAVHGEARYGAGVAFALPIDLLQRAVPEIMRAGFEWFPRLGFALASDAKGADLLDALRQAGAARGEPWLDAIPAHGVVIAVVEEGGPAARAGMRGMLQSELPSGQTQYTVQDIVIELAGHAIESRDEVDRILHDSPAGAELEVVVAGARGHRRLRLVAP